MRKRITSEWAFQIVETRFKTRVKNGNRDVAGAMCPSTSMAVPVTINGSGFSYPSVTVQIIVAIVVQ